MAQTTAHRLLPSLEEHGRRRRELLAAVGTDAPALEAARERVADARRALDAHEDELAFARRLDEMEVEATAAAGVQEGARREAERAQEAELNRVPASDEWFSGIETDLEAAAAWLGAACPWVQLKELRVRRIHSATHGRLHLYYRERGEASFTRMEIGSRETVPDLAYVG